MLTYSLISHFTFLLCPLPVNSAADKECLAFQQKPRILTRRSSNTAFLPMKFWKSGFVVRKRNGRPAMATMYPSFDSTLARRSFVESVPRTGYQASLFSFGIARRNGRLEP